MLIEIMTGSLVGVPMMIDSTSGDTFDGHLPRRGAIVTAYDPATIVDPATFKQKNSELLARIYGSRPLPGEEIHIPGVSAGQRKAASLGANSIDIPEALWQEIKSL